MYIVRNSCAKVRVELKSNEVLRVFSFFFCHPSALSEDQWKLFDGVLVDTPTMNLLRLHSCRWLTDKNETIIGVELQTKLEGEDLDLHKRKCMAYVDYVREGKDVDELVSDLKSLLIQ